MAQLYNLPDAYKGDTYDSIQFTLLINGVALDLTGSAIKIEFRKEKKTGALTKSITDGSGITITDATGGIFIIDAFDLDFSSGAYYYDIQITTAASVITTYIQGILNVTEDVTNG